MAGRNQSGVGRFAWAFALLLVIPAGATRAADCTNGEFNSTYELIEKAVFENRECSNVVCHGAGQAGGLDLRPGSSYDSLMKDSLTVPGMKLVYPGRRDLSLLFINLAAKTTPNEYTAPLRAMPLDPVPALTTNQLEAVRKWIEAGAPREGVVAGTADLLDACLPPPEPIAIDPLPPPAPGKGVQLRMARVDIPPRYESEGCFVSYYDLTDQVPEKYKSPDGKNFRYWRNEARQDPLSHHLIVSRYAGEAAPDDPSWGTFRCVGGENEGTLCQPTNLEFCGAGICASELQQSVACIGFGPPDNNIGLMTAGFAGIQETAAEFTFPRGVFRELPLKGVIIWNTHHFNISDKPGKVEGWLNFEFAEPEDQQYEALQIFDASNIFWQKCKSGSGGLGGCGGANNFQHPIRQVEAFTTKEWCSIHTLPRGARLYEISSHGHRHLKRWRTFLGAFRCEGGPANGEPCSPLGYDMASPDVCKGSPCTAWEKPRSGDCNYDDTIDANELTAAVDVALGKTTVDACPDVDLDGNYKVVIDELVRAVGSGVDGVPPAVQRDGRDSQIYLSYVYNDPIVVRWDETPLIFASPDPDQRALTYCGLYDNGFLDPREVKRKSLSPATPNPLAPGGPCNVPTHCTAGKVGQPCSGAIQSTRDRSCDTNPDEPDMSLRDGHCDACPVIGGVTTEDEMFLLLGGFWVQ